MKEQREQIRIPQAAPRTVDAFTVGGAFVERLLGDLGRPKSLSTLEASVSSFCTLVRVGARLDNPTVLAYAANLPDPLQCTALGLIGLTLRDQPSTAVGRERREELIAQDLEALRGVAREISEEAKN